MTYLEGLKGCGDDGGKRRPRQDEASLYQRRVRKPTATRGLGTRRRTILHARHREIIIRRYLAWGSVGNKAESSRRTGVGLCTRVRTALHETTYNSKDPHSRKPVWRNRYDASFRLDHQLGNKATFANTPGCGCAQESAGEAIMIS
jgi:hypothetical protein